MDYTSIIGVYVHSVGVVGGNDNRFYAELARAHQEIKIDLMQVRGSLKVRLRDVTFHCGLMSSINWLIIFVSRELESVSIKKATITKLKSS